MVEIGDPAVVSRRFMWEMSRTNVSLTSHMKVTGFDNYPFQRIG